MKKKVSHTPSRIAVFSPNKKLIGVLTSQTATAQVLGVRTASIHYACKGKTESCNGWHIRELKDSVKLELPEDFGTLTLEEFDNLNGDRRTMYPDRGMRKRCKQTTSTE